MRMLIQWLRAWFDIQGEKLWQKHTHNMIAKPFKKHSVEYREGDNT